MFDDNVIGYSFHEFYCKPCAEKHGEKNTDKYKNIFGIICDELSTVIINDIEHYPIRQQDIEADEECADCGEIILVEPELTYGQLEASMFVED